MDFEKLKLDLNDLMDKIGLEVKINEVDEDVELQSLFTLKYLNDTEVLMVASCMQDGITTVDFIFNEVIDYDNIYEIVNDYNNKNVFFKAHIEEEDGNFILSAHSYTTELEEQIVNFIDISITGLVDEGNTKLLKKIVNKLDK